MCETLCLLCFIRIAAPVVILIVIGTWVNNYSSNRDA